MSSVPLLGLLASLLQHVLADAQAMLQLDFMRSAFLVGTVTALAAGAVGYFVVLRHLAFAGDALSHVAFAGSLGALVVGLSPLLGLFGITALAGLGLGLLGQRAPARDEAVGTLLAWVLGLGALFLSLYTTHGSGSNATAGVNVLFGSIFGLTASQVHLSVPVGVGAIVALIIIARPLLFASLDPEVAAARGVPVRLLGVVFLVLTAITVAETVPAVGALLVFALMVTPAAIAQRLVTRPFHALTLSVALALAITWVGLTLGYYVAVPISFIISALATVAYVTVLLWQRGARAHVAHREARRRVVPSS